MKQPKEYWIRNTDGSLDYYKAAPIEPLFRNLIRWLKEKLT